MFLKALEGRSALLRSASASVVAAACLMSAPAFAQLPPAQSATAAPSSQPVPIEGSTATQARVEASAAANPEEIIVTGTRIAAGGFTAPTPTTVIGTEQIAANAQPNIFTTIAQLPSLQGSSGTSVNTFSTSSGQQGLSAFSLRGVGTIRTLTLLDGQRVVGANVTGVPDISLFPQLLVQRVDIVNGGAGASYGSDAVGGVVNFITDTHFQGLKGNIQGGITKYGDDKQGLIQVAAGKALLDGRLHLVGSIEYDHEGGVDGGNFGLDMAGSRDWFRSTSQINRNVLNDGLPQYLVRDYFQSITYSKYGLITNGPLQGTAFDQSGRPFQFQYGSNGVPNRAGGVTGCIAGNACLGGDLSGNVDVGRSLKSALERFASYGRVGYDFADNNEVYATFNFGEVRTHNQPINGQNKPNLTIQCANPFVPASIQAACTAAGITSFQFGTSNAALGNTRVNTDRRQYRGVIGAKGKVPVLGSDWTYDAYYEHGINYTALDVRNILLTNRFNQAIDATTINGVIVCRDATARANGCQPLNIIGGNPSQAAINYVQPGDGPYQRTKQTQDAASISFSGSPVELWAGPLSIAFGGEYRREFYRVNADPYGAGFAFTPASNSYPADPVLNQAGNNWYAGNYKNGRGKYSVKEAFFEANLPIINSDALGRANLNGAARVTDYSTSGTIWAWKIGGTWDLPISGLRLRGVTSRDVRAPNLSELFAAPVTLTQTIFNPFSGTNVLAIQNTIGNANLKPETARNTTAGVAIANPSWLPGFNVSFDWYQIKIKDVISSLGANDIVQLCYQNILPSTCSAFNFNLSASGGNFINVQSFNLASINTTGFDIEASYRWRQPLGLPGSFTFRGLATHVIKYITDTGLPGTIPVDSAGSNNGSTPNWKLLLIQSYDTDRFSFLVQERWISDGVIGNQYIECQSNCPVSTNNRPTIDNNFVAGAFYLDIGGSVNLTSNITAYFKVDNLLNKNPPRSVIFSNPAIYDQLGRIYRAGIRFKL